MQVNEETKEKEDSDEEITLFTKRFNKMFKKGQFSRRQGRRNFGKEEEIKKDPIFILKCKESGHMKINCPKLRKDSRKDKKSSKKKLRSSKEHLWLGKKAMLIYLMMIQVIKR